MCLQYYAKLLSERKFPRAYLWAFLYREETAYKSKIGAAALRYILLSNGYLFLALKIFFSFLKCTHALFLLSALILSLSFTPVLDSDSAGSFSFHSLTTFVASEPGLELSAKNRTWKKDRFSMGKKWFLPWQNSLVSCLERKKERKRFWH